MHAQLIDSVVKIDLKGPEYKVQFNKLAGIYYVKSTARDKSIVRRLEESKKSSKKVKFKFQIVSFEIVAVEIIN